MAVIVPGDSRRSILDELVEGCAGNHRMPDDKKDPLIEEKIVVLKLMGESGGKK